MNITLYKFSKKTNSTAIPNSSTPLLSLSNCQIKAGCSIIHPVIEVVKDKKPIDYNYCYIDDWKRYYFIDDITYGLGVWLLSMSVDVLASFRSDILNSNQYVLRSYTEYDSSILDTYYPTTSNVTKDIKYIDTNVTSGSTTIPDYFSRRYNTGAFIISVLGNNGTGVTCYETDYTGLKQIINALSTYVPSDMDDISNGIAKQLYDPFQYIVSCLWYPWAPVDAGTTYNDLYFGQYSIRVNCIELPSNQFVRYHDSVIDLPKHPKTYSRGKYLNMSPYSEYTLYFEPFGAIPLDATKLVDATGVACRWYIDFSTGDAILNVCEKGNLSNVLSKHYAQFGIPIRLTTSSVDILGGASSGLSTIGSLLNLDWRGAIAGAFTAVTNTAIPQPRTMGSQGSFLQQYVIPNISAIFYDIVDEDMANVGRPLCKLKVLSSLSGYTQIGNAHIESLTATDIEKNEITSLMSTGIYLEG